MDIVLNRIAARINKLQANLTEEYRRAREKEDFEEMRAIHLQYDMTDMFLDIMRDEKYKYLKEHMSATYGSACEMD